MLGKFTFGSEAVVSRDFTFSGVRYAKGRAFPYKELGIIEFDARGLWRAELIEFTGKPYVVASAKELSDADLERLTAPAAKPAVGKQAAARR